jgi:hypothetical protein
MNESHSSTNGAPKLPGTVSLLFERIAPCQSNLPARPAPPLPGGGGPPPAPAEEASHSVIQAGPFITLRRSEACHMHVQRDTPRLPAQRRPSASRRAGDDALAPKILHGSFRLKPAI